MILNPEPKTALESCFWATGMFLSQPTPMHSRVAGLCSVCGVAHLRHSSCLPNFKFSGGGARGWGEGGGGGADT